MTQQDGEAPLAHEELISRERVYDGAVLHVRRDVVRVHKATGAVDAVREVVDHPQAVVIAAVGDDGNVLLVRQRRWAVGEALLEAPAGRLEPGESPEDGARRELREETGHAADTLHRLGGFWVAPGYSTEYIHAFLATNLHPDPLPPDVDEDIAVVPVPWDDIPRLITEAAVIDAKSVAALQMAYFLHGKPHSGA